jgi:ATP-binding cassette subfamily B protein
VSSPAPDVLPPSGDAAAPERGGEFLVTGSAVHDHESPTRWLWSHARRLGWLPAVYLLGTLAANITNSMIPGYTGRAFDRITGVQTDKLAVLTQISLTLLLIVVVRGLCDGVGRVAVEVGAQRMVRECRLEVFTTLLGKSQTFHNRQRVGDLMARATNDVRQIGWMISPGLDLIVDSMIALLVPLAFIALIDLRLLVTPLAFAVLFFFALRYYMRKLSPVSTAMRETFGEMNAGLNEAVRGIEVIKAAGQEVTERLTFNRRARANRDQAVRQGVVQAWYLPTLLLALTTAAALVQGVVLVRAGELSVGGLIAYLGLISQLQFPTGISTFSFSMVQMGIAGARRVLELMTEEDQVASANTGADHLITGAIAFEHVTFSYGAAPVLRDLSFSIEPGQTVAIVGETGAGKSTLAKLVNRTYDPTAGVIRIDGIDIADFRLDSLRSQISTIEQDITLFSRSVAENIAFGRGGRATREEVEEAARGAAAHEFILELPEGYDTVIGERGVTLSGGQRQRLAIARALLSDPALLILDDSTSAIDSNTEDQIARAIRRVLMNRTTLLITHRLSQIRSADTVLLLRRGALVDAGGHQELLDRSPLYRRIFAHYDEVPEATPVLHPTTVRGGRH